MKFHRIGKGLLLFGASIVLLSACSSGTSNSSDGSSSEKSDKNKTVGILQAVQHSSLDAAHEGFIKGLKEEGFEEGKNLTINYQNAQNDQSNLKSMSEKLVKEKPDLLLGIATPAALSLLNETTEIPIVVTAVTDLVGQKLVKSDEEPGGNVTGTTDMVPIDKQIDLLLSIIPDGKKVGILYNASEANSVVQVNLAKKALEKAGIEVKEATANTTNDVQQATQSIAKEVDGIYIPTDNTFASAASIVGEVAKEEKVPVVTGSVEQVEAGGLATYGLNYTSLGEQTGKMAAKILKGEAKPATMPVESADKLELVVNDEMAKAIGIDPSSIKAPE